jgi:hypothetical protein
MDGLQWRVFPDGLIKERKKNVGEIEGQKEMRGSRIQGRQL